MKPGGGTGTKLPPSNSIQAESKAKSNKPSKASSESSEAGDSFEFLVDPDTRTLLPREAIEEEQSPRNGKSGKKTKKKKKKSEKLRKAEERIAKEREQQKEQPIEPRKQPFSAVNLGILSMASEGIYNVTTAIAHLPAPIAGAAAGAVWLIAGLESIKSKFEERRNAKAKP